MRFPAGPGVRTGEALACGGRGWWRGMWRASGGAPSARLRRHPCEGGLWPRRRGRELSAKFGGITVGSFQNVVSRPRARRTRPKRGGRGGDKAHLALPRRFPTSAKSVDKPLFLYYKFSPIFFTFRSRRSEPCRWRARTPRASREARTCEAPREGFVARARGGGAQRQNVSAV